ncbi:MAG: hypothetical protein IH881_09300 [Myxococcales bacterium]|nr:hypothetical protein [Myxococcales bacterium]
MTKTKTRKAIDESMKLYPAEKLNMGIGAGAIAASFAIASPHFAGSLAIGVALEAVNFRFLHRTAEALFTGVVNGGGPWVVVLGLRLGLVFGGIIAALMSGADPVGLVIGLSLAMPATVAAAVWNRPKLVPQDPAPAIGPEDPSWDEFSVWNPGRQLSHRAQETE